MEDKAIYVQIVNEYLQCDKVDFYPLGLFKGKKATLDALRGFASKYPARKEEIDLIIDNIDHLMECEYTSEHFMAILNYKKYSSNSTKLLYDVLSHSDEEALDLLYKCNVDFRSCSSALIYIKKYFKNQTKDIERLERIFNSYKERKVSKKNDKNRYININLTDDRSACITSEIKELYDSNLSIEEYCSQTGNRINQMRVACEKLKSSKSFNHQIVATQILLRDSSDFYKYLTNCIYELVSMENIDILDYYQRTRLQLNELRDLIQLMGINNKKTQKLVINLKQIMKRTQYTTRFEQLNAKTIISGVEITTEEKEKILNYLDENNIPYNACYTAYKRYVTGTLDFSKTLVKGGKHE